ncbi:Gamma-aminobutyric acid type B receptor subunit 1 [Orchesella cincta]|uniref:Gamma-aminobutyric acid type B receptor subunit 1 n=1 Tax=Orchesella cincta TaxID=48709 RepID=A0A1D2M2U1_ORCCI|nr:Gamma-aminobutyric acid type B receptor subunit 1 [Orchesella cincta]
MYLSHFSSSVSRRDYVVLSLGNGLTAIMVMTNFCGAVCIFYHTDTIYVYVKNPVRLWAVENACKNRCYADYSYPTEVVGVFNRETSAPATAASLAVDNFNLVTSNLTFKYKNVNLEVDDYGEISRNNTFGFQNNIIVTGSSSDCEELALILPNFHNSVLVCYGTPTAKTLAILQSSPDNMYLSQPNPKALILSLFKVVKLLANLADESSTCKPLAYVIVSNRDHEYRQAAVPLLNNFKHESSRVTLLQSQPQSLNSYLAEVDHEKSETMSIVVAMVDAVEARTLFCRLHKKKHLGSKYLIILAGHYIKKWLDDPEYYYEDDNYENHVKNDSSCEMEQFLAAAEGHFLLDIPDWNPESVNSSYVNNTNGTLINRLQRNNEGIRKNFDEAPLAYDSVWAMIRAISLAREDVGNGIGENLKLRGAVMEKLGEPFTGLSSKFSFNNAKMRNAADSVITIQRFENGSYVHLGRHYNENSSFVWCKHLISPDVVQLFRDQPHSSCLESDSIPDKWNMLIILPIVVLFIVGSLLCTYLIRDYVSYSTYLQSIKLNKNVKNQCTQSDVKKE